MSLIPEGRILRSYDEFWRILSKICFSLPRTLIFSGALGPSAKLNVHPNENVSWISPLNCNQSQLVFFCLFFSFPLISLSRILNITGHVSTVNRTTCVMFLTWVSLHNHSRYINQQSKPLWKHNWNLFGAINRCLLESCVLLRYHFHHLTISIYWNPIKSSISNAFPNNEKNLSIVFELVPNNEFGSEPTDKIQ